MTYKEAKEKAINCKSYEEIDELLKLIEDDENITDQQYYWVKHLGIEAAYRIYERV